MENTESNSTTSTNVPAFRVVGPGVAVHDDCGHPDWPDCPHYSYPMDMPDDTRYFEKVLDPDEYNGY